MKSLLFAILVLCAHCLFAQSPKTTRFSGRITDIAGASIAGARVDIHWNVARAAGPTKPDRADLMVHTDMFGEFSAVLTPGFYDVCVHVAGFSPNCETVSVGSESVLGYKASLKPDPLIIEERPDLFRIEEITPNPVPTVTPDHAETVPKPK